MDNSNTQNRIHGEFKSKMKSRNVFHDSTQNRLSSSFLSNNTEIKINRTKVCLLFCMGVKCGLLY